MSSVLNVIPGVGLGDLITVLLENALPLGQLIPTGYKTPQILDSSAINITLSSEAGKLGVGGFAGSLCGTVVRGSSLKDTNTVIAADTFGGGFAGVARDGILEGTLNGLGVDIANRLHPQTEISKSSIENSNLTIQGGSYLGGFAGVLANSYLINDEINEPSTITINATGDFIGGFAGYARLGTLFGLGDYLVTGVSLLGTVKGLVTGLLGSGSDQSLLDLGGVASSAILGARNEAVLNISSEGNYVGGIIGRGDGVHLTSSNRDKLLELPKFERDPSLIPIAEEECRNTTVSAIESVSGKNYSGGIVGYLTSANIGGLLGDTLGVGQYLGFDVSQIDLQGIPEGYTVQSTEDYSGGAVGWAVGGDVKDINLYNLKSVTANNRAGGFVGATGPGDLVNGNGLDLQLLGISLISIDNLLSLVSGIRTTYARANVSGIAFGFTVEETGFRSDGDVRDYSAGGFAAQANSVTVDDSFVRNLKSVKANASDGIAGGFVGMSSAGGLAGVVEEGSTLSALQLGQLLNAVPYMVPKYNGCAVFYTDGGFVEGDAAGGFAGEFQSGKVNADSEPYPYQTGTPEIPWSVNNIHHVRGRTYAGGWGGNVYSGALVSAGGGLSILGGLTNVDISVQDLLGVASVYVPIVKYAGVSTPQFSVYSEGYAGGYIGYGSGVQVSYSDVNQLKHGIVTPPADLEGVDGSAYMNFDNSPENIPYAVAGGHYAGGYIGHMDIGSAASLGGGLKLLGNKLSLSNVLDALSVVVSTIEHSDVYGAPGGFSVIASGHIDQVDGTFSNVGYAGGYVGKISGGHIQDGNVELFEYVIGEIAAGGYAGEAEPGDVAHILDNGSLSLLGQVNGLASLVQDFVPTIRNSQTTCVPCGGGVRAQAFSDDSSSFGNVVRGMAGGYIGHSKGAQIWGNSEEVWKEENTEADLFGKMTKGVYAGEKRENAAIRIRSVYGAEYAGGYVGLMEAGSTAQTGGLSLLGGLISADNLIGALNAVYPTIRYGAVYGPLEKVSLSLAEQWRDIETACPDESCPAILKKQYSSQEELDEEIARYVYGYNVVSGRTEFDAYNTTVLSGTAGGFAGSMHSGTIRNSHAEDAKLVRAMRASGGFVGEMQTKGLAEFGSVNLLGDALSLNLGNLLSVANVFVPAISGSGVNGYQSGLTVQTTGTNGSGNAGGYVGASYGGQLGRKYSGTIESVWAKGLKTVYGSNAVGGFVGLSTAASILSADTTDAANGFLQKLLDKLISTPAKTVDLLKATVSTIKYAEVDSYDPEYGFVVDGPPADYAGGFAGNLEATVLGERNNPDDKLIVNHLRSVNGGYYSGGFFGIADVGSVAEVGGSDGSSSKTSILNLIQAGNVSVLDAFRTYIYHAEVNGVPDGIRVYASKYGSSGIMSTYQVSGDAGGFGGGLMNGTVENSSVTNLNYVEAPNYAGGFIGFMGKNGGVTVDEAKVTNNNAIGTILSGLGLNLGANAQLLNIVGSTVKNCEAGGFRDGFVVKTTETQIPITDVVDQADLKGSAAGGFTGFADISQIENSTVNNLKYVESPQLAAGFIGRSSMAYIADIDVSSGLTGAVVQIVNLLIKALYLDEAEKLNLLNLDAGILGLKLLSDGDLLYVNLLGLKIGVSLIKNDPEYAGGDAAVITIGSSTIKVPCDENGITGETPDVSINLFEGNRTTVKNSSVTGNNDGYDVFAGGGNYDSVGEDTFGYAGGFIAYNDNGYLSHDEVVQCDLVIGTPDKIGPFAGRTVVNSRTVDYLEGNDNVFSIYRSFDPLLERIETSGSALIATGSDETVGEVRYLRYLVDHLDVIKKADDLKDAVEKGAGAQRELAAYPKNGRLVLMRNTKQNSNSPGDTVSKQDMKDPCDDIFDLHIQKIWDDLLNVKQKRPGSITVNIIQQDVGTEEPETLISAGEPTGETIDSMSVTLSEEDRSKWSTTWEKTIPDLPVAYDDEGTVHYYQYFISEERVPEYETTYETDADTNTVTIRNSFLEIIPDLGGRQSSLIIPGLCLLCISLYILRKGRKVI